MGARGMCCVPILALVMATVAPAGAQTADGIEQAWRAWMAKHDRKNGGLAVVHGGQAVRDAGMGREPAGTPVPVASLSKAVTGVCIAGLIERKMGPNVVIQTADGPLVLETRPAALRAEADAGIDPYRDQRIVSPKKARRLRRS